jgi:hypothetical protein
VVKGLDFSEYNVRPENFSRLAEKMTKFSQFFLLSGVWYYV